MSMARVHLSMPGACCDGDHWPGWRPLVKETRAMKRLLSPPTGRPDRRRGPRTRSVAGVRGAETWLPGGGALRQTADPET